MVKYAVPVSGGEVCPHFGHCEHFALIDVDPAAKQITGKNMVASPGHEPGFLPGWLAQQGANIILAGGMGQRAVDLFKQAGVQVIVGARENDPEKAVLAHLNDTLDTDANFCDH